MDVGFKDLTESNFLMWQKASLTLSSKQYPKISQKLDNPKMKLFFQIHPTRFIFQRYAGHKVEGREFIVKNFDLSKNRFLTVFNFQI